MRQRSKPASSRAAHYWELGAGARRDRDMQSEERRRGRSMRWRFALRSCDCDCNRYCGCRVVRVLARFGFESDTRSAREREHVTHKRHDDGARWRRFRAPIRPLPLLKHAGRVRRGQGKRQRQQRQQRQRQRQRRQQQTRRSWRRVQMVLSLPGHEEEARAGGRITDISTSTSSAVVGVVGRRDGSRGAKPNQWLVQTESARV